MSAPQAPRTGRRGSRRSRGGGGAGVLNEDLDGLSVAAVLHLDVPAAVRRLVLVLHPVVAQGDNVRRISVVVAAGPSTTELVVNSGDAGVAGERAFSVSRSIYDPAAG